MRFILLEIAPKGFTGASRITQEIFLNVCGQHSKTFTSNNYAWNNVVLRVNSTDAIRCPTEKLFHTDFE